MRKFFSVCVIVAAAAFGGYGLYRAEAAEDRADATQVSLEKARAACTRFNDLIPSESRAMWPKDATPEERMMFVLDQKQRELDARPGNHFPGGARLTVRFLETPVAYSSAQANSPRQETLVPRE